MNGYSMTPALKKALDGNEDLITEVTQYETTAKTNADNVQGLERDLKTAIDKRQSLKDLIRKTTGLSELTEESLSKLGSGDDALRSEVTALQEKLSETIADRDSLNGKHSHEMNSMRMLDMLRGMGVDTEVWNPKAFEAVAGMMLDGAEYTDGAFQYKSEDGATVFGESGSALTVQEKLSQLKTDESVYQFKPQTGGGAGASAPTSMPNGAANSDKEVAAHFRKFGKLPEGYGKTA